MKKYLIALLSILLLANFFSFECFAFKSGYIYEAIHKKMIIKALKPKGFLDKNLNLVVKGADSQDAITSKKFTDSPSHHFDDNLIKESIAYFKDRFSKAVAFSSSKAYQHYGSAEQRSSVRDTLYTFGEGLHTIQDFYSHSNYVEMLAASGNKDVLANWKALPAGIKTGYFYWSSHINNESTRSRATSVKKIKSLYKSKGQTLTFHTNAEWKKRKASKSYKDSTAYVLNPKIQCLHLELNKDDANQTAGAPKLPDGRTMHAKARSLAIRETERQWKEFKKAIKKKHGTRSQLILPALLGYDAPVIKLKVKLPSTVQEGKAIPINCNVNLNYSPIDKPLGLKNPGKYDLIIRATVYKDGKREVRVSKRMKKRSCGSTGGIAFNLPPLNGTGERTVKFKAMFAGDKRFRSAKKTKVITVGDDSLAGSKWVVRAYFKGKLGTRKYSVKVIDDTESAFSVRVMGYRKGDKPSVFKGTRKKNVIKLNGWHYFKETKLVGANGSLDKLSAGKVVETGRILKRRFKINATLNTDQSIVRGAIEKGTKLSGKRINQ